MKKKVELDNAKIQNNFIKLTQKGISLIVLVITIIVIIILSTSVMLTISNNNPIKEANVARYESDRDNIQSIFTNTVAKVMVKNLGTVSITAGQINTITNGINSTTGEVSYTVTGATISINASGKIVFGKGENTDTVFYTGKQLPIYKAGDTKWYVTDEGEILLEVAGNKYGSGEIVESDQKLEPGVYDENNVMLASWDELVNDYGLDIASNYTNSTYKTSANTMYSVLANNEELSTATKFIISNDVTNIGEYALGGCESLTNILIPDSVTSIGTRAFLGCTSMTSVTIPESVTSIGIRVFASCSGLASIKVDEQNTVYDSRKDCNAIIETATNLLISGCKNTVIYDTVTDIAEGAFYKCTGLTSVIIPDSVTDIGEVTFYGCTGLTSITIPDSVTIIKRYSFYECTGLTSITIPDSVTIIEDKAFYDCTALESVELHSVTIIGQQAFYNCSALESVILSDTLTDINSWCFSGCSSLESVTIPNSVMYLGNSAFEGCKSLTSIVIPNQIETIETQTFYMCSSLESVTIPDSVKTLGNRCFSDCTALKSITIPDSVKSIAIYTFLGCENLTTINYKGTATGKPWGASNATVG